ncbi:ABC transporter permease [Rhizobium tubonense]|uniref:Sugar ABC transporter permease n=1 Tax=Rhizobium tubonense TaxID=484088 RepID=A0A2W4E951_9HYPH|nr:ABC transporter permease [Rhizobium tubonense]PZM08190.1 sugar ABC transporter permease [Rhizobium tubonense]
MMTSRKSLSEFIGRYGVIAALVALIIFGALRYDNFLGEFNILTFMRYNSMFALVSLGMAFVIMTGGIDLSVGAVAALGSVVSAMASPYGFVPGLLAGAGVGLVAGLLNGLMVTRLGIFPFIATLAMMLAAKGTALLLSGNASVEVDYDSTFTVLGQGDLFAFPIPAWIALLCFIAGSIVLNFTEIGRTTLAIGGNEDATRLMGLPIDRVKLMVYAASGTLAAIAGVILASQFGAGQPIEGQGWELFAIAAVVVGGTSLMGGKGSVGTTLAGVALLGLIFNILNFENGLGWISLSAYWQSVVRGVFLLIVVVLQTRLGRRDLEERLG